MRTRIENYLVRFVCGKTDHDIVHIADVTVVGDEDRIEEDVRADLHDALDHFIDCVNEKWNDLMLVGGGDSLEDSVPKTEASK